MPLPTDPESRRAFGRELCTQPGFESLLKLIDTLLGQDGCPWDRSRRLEDCPEYLREELGEVVEAIESGSSENLEEELGDLLFMTVFTARLGEKGGRMSIEAMFQRILDKMVYRHPHVFGGEMKAETPDEVLANWRELKRREKEGGK